MSIVIQILKHYIEQQKTPDYYSICLSM